MKKIANVFGDLGGEDLKKWRLQSLAFRLDPLRSIYHPITKHVGDAALKYGSSISPPDLPIEPAKQLRNGILLRH